MEKQTQDLIIIGGGIMGLCTAYAASYFTNNIILLEKSRIGNPETASFGYTRSIRNDYLDPFYARLAYEARRLWLELERKATEPLIIQCGCLNIAKESVTPDLDATYAAQSYRTLTSLHLHTEAFTRDTLQQRFPQFTVDLARLDVEAGFLYLPAVTQTLLEILRQRQVNIMEDVEVVAVEQQADALRVVTSTANFSTKSLVITAGLRTNEVLRRIAGCSMQFSLIPDRPMVLRYNLRNPGSASLPGGGHGLQNRCAVRKPRGRWVRFPCTSAASSPAIALGWAARAAAEEASARSSRFCRRC